jgi:hypothetical protein
MSDLDELYDDVTLAAIEGRTGEPTRWQGRAASGTLVLGMMQGVKDALDDEEEVEPVVEIDEEHRASRLEAVTVHLVPGCPAASIAIVRRWLL